MWWTRAEHIECALKDVDCVLHGMKGGSEVDVSAHIECVRIDVECVLIDVECVLIDIECVLTTAFHG